MAHNIPLEDGFTDIIGKAQRGQSITDEALAGLTGISLTAIQSLKGGELDEAALAKVSEELGLGGNALLALAKGSYQPAPVAEPEGLACFNTVFEDMTVNSYLVWDPATREAAFFDTGADGQPMLDFAEARGLKVKQIFITHIHTDHVLDLDRLVEKTGAHAWVCVKEPLTGAESFEPGRSFKIGKLTVDTRETSGHAAGGVTYVVGGLGQPVAIVGDSIFAASMGGGMVSYSDAVRNNREQVLTLPDATILCSGHGPLTTVGEQKIANPFFAA
ncbi:MAG: Zn-dependent hydrolase, glyoxylase family [Verrucomicrobiota bacterium]|jgi:glyoxylase-like metal-dependent hydrolase (beta-lactamase superfamily II)